MVNFWALPVAGSVAAALAFFTNNNEFIFIRYFFEEAKAIGFSHEMAVKEGMYMFYDVAEAAPEFDKIHDWMGLYSHVRPQVKETDNHIVQVCKVSLYTRVMETQPPFLFMDTADPGTTVNRLGKYLESCMKVYQALEDGSPQKALLDNYTPDLGEPGDIENVTMPIYHGPMNEEEYWDMRRRRFDHGVTKPDLADRRMKPEDFPEWARERMLKNNALLPVKHDEIPASEAMQAIWEGRVAVFNATELDLPKNFWGMDLIEMAKMHEDIAEDIPVYKMRSASVNFGWDSLADVRTRLELLRKADKLYHNSEVPIPRHANWTPRVETAIAKSKQLSEMARFVGEQVGDNPEDFSHWMRRAPGQTTTNVRRLPRLGINMEKAMGNPEWLERSWSMLWAGAVSSFWHNDEPDNLIISVNREINVGVFLNMSDTDIINGKKNPGDAPHPEYMDLVGFHAHNVTEEFIDANKWIKKYPYIAVRLKPGQGITIPSRMYHSVWAEDTDRLVLNAFMIPKYKGMRQAPRPKTSFYDTQDDLYLAFWHLKMSSLAKLWDDHKLGGFFSGTKLEIM